MNLSCYFFALLLPGLLGFNCLLPQTQQASSTRVKKNRMPHERREMITECQQRKIALIHKSDRPHSESLSPEMGL